MKFEQTGKEISSAGRVIEYTLCGSQYTVESRLRHIPHANGRSGTWEHTTYAVLKSGDLVKEYATLKDAKAAAINAAKAEQED